MLLETKTYQQMIEENKVVFPTEVDEPTKQLIYDWFQFMHVVDDDKFPIFFKRQLSHEYSRYKQLLRIEPGYAEYDWLVKNYEEIMNEKTSTTENIGELNGNVEGTRGSTTSREGTADVSSNSKTEDRGTITKDFDSTETSNGETSKTGNDTSTKTGTETLVRTPNLTETRDLTETKTLGQSIQKTTDNDSRVTRDLTTGVSSDTINIEKSLPQDPVYTGNKVSGVVSGVKVFESPDFTYASGYNEQTFNSSQDQTGGETSSGTVTETTTPLTGSDKIENSGTIKTSGTENSETTYNVSDKTDYNSTVNDSGTFTKEDTDLTTLNTDKTETKSGTKTLNDTATTETTNTTSTSQTDSRTINASIVDKNIKTGRDEAPADILARATKFIVNTDAWEWLKDRLMICFLSTYDI